MLHLVLVLALTGLAGCAPPVPVLPAPDGEVPADGSGPRWSVEIDSDDDLARAEDMASVARLRFDDVVTVEPIGGVHHVRVGEFRTHEEAAELAVVARELGYRSARVVTLGLGGAAGP